MAKFSDFLEATIGPGRNDYLGSKFERFMRETKNVECPGCGNVGLYEYLIVDEAQGLLRCPGCLQQTDLKTLMRSWLAVTGDFDTLQ